MTTELKTGNVVLDQLHQELSANQLLIDKIEKHTWKDISLPMKLTELLSTLPKTELDTIRKKYDIKGVSSLKKAELALELASRLPQAFSKILNLLDQERYSLLKTAKANGYLQANAISLTSFSYFQENGMLFPGLVNGEKVVVITEELSAVLSEVDSDDFERVIDRNTEWIHLTHGLLYYYGVMSREAMAEAVKQFTTADEQMADYLSVVLESQTYYNRVKVTPTVMQDVRLLWDSEKIVAEQNMFSHVNFYSFNKQQLLSAGNPDYIEKTSEITKLRNFLQSNYAMSVDRTDEITARMIQIMNNDAQPNTVLTYLQEELKYPAMEQVKQLAELVFNVFNNTRMWALKGYTPNELGKIERKNMNRQSTIQKEQIGRNEPCPCGSGKKYKKCCGK